MLFNHSKLSLLAVSTLLSPTLAQLKLPGCIRECINKSPDTNCSAADIACLCRASSSEFLPNLVTCIHDECVNLEPGILLGPLQFACNIAGAPIPDSIIQEVESKASYLATASATAATTVVSSVVITTTAEGSTQTLIYPITIEKTTTISGEPSTVSHSGSSAATGTQVVPVLITTTDSRGSTYTTTATSQTTLVSSPSSSSPTTIRTSTTAGAATQASTSTSQQSSLQTSSSSSTNAPPASQTNSAPFTNTNIATGLKVSELGSWLSLGVAVVVGAL